MDKAVLKQKAEDYALKQWEGQLPWSIIQKAYYDGYRDCEKEMNEIGLALQSDMDRTIEQNIALKKQIEKMKCCGNCSKNGHICVAEEMQGKLCGKNKDKWELRR